jgi:hypothetical protein
MNKERRDDQRVPTGLVARWDGLSGAAESRVDDISLGGCFINTKTQVRVGEIVGLEIKLKSGELLRLRGEVVSHQPGIGFGVVFSFLTHEEEETLRRLLTSLPASV